MQKVNSVLPVEQRGIIDYRIVNLVEIVEVTLLVVNCVILKQGKGNEDCEEEDFED